MSCCPNCRKYKKYKEYNGKQYDFCCKTCQWSPNTHGGNCQQIPGNCQQIPCISHKPTIYKHQRSINLQKLSQFTVINMNNQKTSGGNEQSLNNIEASGIIPYYLNNNKIYILLGYDPNQTKWKYFGGGKESVDSNSISTAYREFIEETCTINGYCYLDYAKNSIFNDLQNGNGLCIPKLNSQSKKWNNFYFIKIDKQWDAY